MSQFDNAFETTMEKLWENKKYNTLRDVLVTMQPAQVAALFAMMPDNAPAPSCSACCPRSRPPRPLWKMEPDMQEKLIRSFSDTELKSVLDELYVDDAVDLVEEMPAQLWSSDCWLRPTRICARASTSCCAIPRTAPAPS